MSDGDLVDVRELVEHMSVLELRPGDVLVLTYPDELTVEQAERLRAHLREALPGHDAVVLSGGVRLGAARFE